MSFRRLIEVDDMRGDLQMHSTWSDGKNTIEEMLTACAAKGYEYVALTDHSKALAMTGGLDAAKLREQWREIEEVTARHPEIRFLRSQEVDILADGALDTEDEMLEQLDLVVIAVHSRFDLPAAQADRATPEGDPASVGQHRGAPHGQNHQSSRSDGLRARRRYWRAPPSTVSRWS